MNIKQHIRIATLGTTALLAASASAGMTGRALEDCYAWEGEDFGGASVSGWVCDLYLEFDSAEDILLNIYDFNDIKSGNVYHQGVTAAGWAPNEQGSIFTTEVSQSFDSFIAIGGVTEYGPDGRPYQMAGNGVGVDPNFGGLSAAGPGENAGWYNGNPNNPHGQAQESDSGYFLVFIGRFAKLDSDGFSMAGSYGSATFNQGIGTEPTQSGFVVVPAPGALALLGIAGLTGGRRRRN